MTARPWPRWPAFAGPDGKPLLELNELMEARYRHHLATGFRHGIAVLLAEWDVAGYLRAIGARRAPDVDAPRHSDRERQP